MKKALVVDDDSRIRSLVHAILSVEGFKVTEASDGEQACKILSNLTKSTNDINLVVLDVMMPKMTGFEVLTFIRDQPNFTDIPVIMLTAEDKNTDIINGYSKGSNYYVTKPFTREQLIYGLRLVMT
jgi:DNA-binding response OmpR family regulator